MSNHYHLLLRTRRANLSRAIQWFAGTYTRRFNNRHGRSGRLFQGRFKSILVETDREDEADAAQGKISWVSTLARALSEARVAEAVAWKRPAREIALTIVAIRYPS
jgi:hypothetical protein